MGKTTRRVGPKRVMLLAPLNRITGWSLLLLELLLHWGSRLLGASLAGFARRARVAPREQLVGLSLCFELLFLFFLFRFTCNFGGS